MSKKIQITVSYQGNNVKWIDILIILIAYPFYIIHKHSIHEQ